MPLASTAITAAKVLFQIKTGAAPIEILEIRVGQLTKTATEIWQLEGSQWTGSPTAGTVTSVTPIPIDPGDPAALAVGSTTATGVIGTDPSGGTQNKIFETAWNILNGEWVYLPIPEGRDFWIPASGKLFTLKVISTPAASTNVVGRVLFREYS